MIINIHHLFLSNSNLLSDLFFGQKWSYLIRIIPIFFSSLSPELVTLRVSPTVVAKFNTRVTLHCNASTSQNGLLIKHMGWTQDTKLCSVNEEGTVISHHSNFTSPFHCEYEDGRLSLVFQRMQPLEIKKHFMCKLRSNQGVVHGFTTVELQGQSPLVFWLRV